MRHLNVIHHAAPNRLTFSGGLGPLQDQAAYAVLNIQLKSEEKQTRIDWTYRVSGYMPAGFAAWAKPVDGVIAEQFSRLKKVINGEKL